SRPGIWLRACDGGLLRARELALRESDGRLRLTPARHLPGKPGGRASGRGCSYGTGANRQWLEARLSFFNVSDARLPSRVAFSGDFSDRLHAIWSYTGS